MTDFVRKQVFDKERIQWNTAWLKSHGEHFEIVINPDEALEYRRTSGKQPEIKECIRSEHIFADAKKGQLASEEALEKVFKTEDELQIARRLILEGEIQLSAEHRQQIRDEKRKRIMNKIKAYAVDPTTGLPHPLKRLELAMEEAKVKIDEREDEDRQIQEIVRKLQPIIPIKLETVTLQIHLPSKFGQKLYGDLERLGSLKKTDWLSDGGLLAWVELPAGMQNQLIEELASKSHGAAEVKKVDENPM